MKSRSKKIMRVATTFTGVTASAVAFGPPAMAGTATHLQTGERQRQDITTSHIEVRPCSGGTSNWVHMAWNYPNTKDLCYGFRGLASNPYVYYSLICGGNNIGSYGSSSPRGNVNRAYFHQGNTYARLSIHASWLTIKSWQGHDKCPLPPGIIPT
jgi:hypothetical protein